MVDVKPEWGNFSRKSENYKTLESIKEVIGRQSEKKGGSKGESKAKRETKALKSTKIDLVQVDLTIKSARTKKEEKVDLCLEQFEEAYEKLKKTMVEKKQAILQNDNLVEVLENLKNQMIQTRSVLKNAKAE